VAIARAESGIACGAAGEDLGLLRLVEAEASVWRGELAVGEARGVEATGLLPVGCTAWFRAVTQAVIAAGKQGGFDRVEAGVASALAAAPAPGARGIQLTCLSLATIQLLFGGRYAAAEALIAKIERAAGDLAALDPQTRDVVQQMRATRASIMGDSAACLEGFMAALAANEETGDRRNACVNRSNIGFMLAELGDFQGAEEALRPALADGDRLGLHDVTTAVLQNLGYALAYCGRLDEARAYEQRAVDAFARAGDPRMEGSARAYLARIALLSGDPVAAEREVRTAVRLLEIAPPLRAAAVAVLARALLEQGRAEEALPVATDAFTTLVALGMIEEGETLVRLVHAEALAAVGRAGDFQAAIADAATHLRARAGKISDAAWRERFLAAVPDNARTLALAGEAPDLGCAEA